MKLVIVESPNKVDKIASILGPQYRLKASFGHVRDLPKDGGLAITFSNGQVKPRYEVSARRDVLASLRAAAAQADEIILATDPDREGEAIAWHLKEVIGKHRYSRVTFQALTKDAVLKAIASPRDIDYHLVEAQQARRVLDRVLGWLVSPTCRGGTGDQRAVSAGRCQSVALRIVVEREREILDFKSQTFHVVRLKVEKPGMAPAFWAKLVRWGEKDIPRGVLRPEDAQMILSKTEQLPLKVLAIQTNRKSRQPPPPFTTASVQQAASIQLGLAPDQTMSLLQNLFESAAITYHRTDSVVLSPEAIAMARSIIGERFSAAYLPASPVRHLGKAANAQEAHEAVRPTHPENGPDEHGADVRGRLYALIWHRFIASQMSPAVCDVTVLDIIAGEKAVFRATGTQVVFDGWRKLSEDAAEENSAPSEDEERALLPPVVAGDALTMIDRGVTKSSTKPPARFTQASLIKKLESDGIGRPSTYATILKTLLARQYVEDKGKKLNATPLGMTLIDFLVRAYKGGFIELGYTAQMEEDLDRVARGERPWQPLITEASQALLVAAQAAGLSYDPLAGEERSEAPQQRREVPSTSQPKPCRTCGAPIHLLQDGARWIPLNPDGTPHRDQKRGKSSGASRR